MKIICYTYTLAETIQDDESRAAFLKKHDPDKQPWIEMQTYERWTNQQQGKVWRDLENYGKEIFLCSGNYVYKKILQGDKCPFKNLFVEYETMTINGKERREELEKGLSKFTKADIIELLEVMPEYLEHLACHVHQEVILFNWSCKENQEADKPFCEFTEKPYDAEREIGTTKSKLEDLGVL